jgi:hypothetical protein
MEVNSVISFIHNKPQMEEYEVTITQKNIYCYQVKAVDCEEAKTLALELYEKDYEEGTLEIFDGDMEVIAV